MANKIDNLVEELSSEPRSPDYDSVLSSMLQIIPNLYPAIVCSQMQPR